MLAATYQVNSPDVVHETVDGEVVMVHLTNGSYYSMDGVGAEIWRLLAGGIAVTQVVTAVCDAYAGDAETIQQSILQLVEQLCSERLLIPGPGGAGQVQPALSVTPDGSTAYTAPELHKYTDMEELLLVDPVHDVTEAGWPHARDALMAQ